jgi:hypothetical protein
MSNRSVVMVIILSLVTFGIYPIYWYVKTKDEMVQAGADIPTAWLLIVPIVNIYWTWKWCGGVEVVTRGKTTQVIAFILVALLSVIGMAIIQASFNQAAEEARTGLPRARVA